MGAVCESKVGCASKERLRKPIRGALIQIWFIPIHFSSGKGRVVIGPDHGPHVDVEQGTYTTGSGDGRYMHFVPIWPWQ